MAGGSIQCLTDTLEGGFDVGVALYVETKAAGDVVDLGRIERDTAPVDCSDELSSAGVVGQRRCLRENQGLEPGEKARRPT